jgi:PAS domain S-box-containing protein
MKSPREILAPFLHPTQPLTQRAAGRTGIRSKAAWVYLLGFGPALAILLAVGVAQYRTIQALVQTEEYGRLADRQSAGRTSATRAVGLTVFSSLLALVLGAAATWIIHRDNLERKQAEEAWRESAERAQIVTESVVDVIYEWDLKNKVEWRGDVDSLMGYPAGGFPRTFNGWAATLHPEDKERVMLAVESQLRGAAPYNVEYRIAKKGGRWRWWSARGTALRDERGQPRRWVGAITDITEREQAVEELRRIEWMLSKTPASIIEGRAEKLEQAYGDLTELNRDGLIVKSVGRERLGSIVSDYLDLLGTSSAVYEANGDYAFGIFASGWCRMLDRSSRNLCETPDNAAALNSGKWLCHESCWTCCSKEAIAKGAPVDIECNGGIRLYSEPIYAHDAVIGAINFGYGDPPKDPAKLRELADAYRLDYEELRREAEAYDSRPVYIIEMAKRRLRNSAGLIGSMVEAEQAQESLRESEAQFRTLANAIPQLCWMANADGWIFWYNQLWYEYTGTTPEQVEGWGWQSVHDPEALPEVLVRWKASIATGEPFDMVFPLRGADGVFRPFLTRVKPVRDQSGRINRWFGTSTDITEHKRAEEEIKSLNEQLEQRVRERTVELEAANKDLEAFTYSVSHDLRAPLRHIDGFSKLLVEQHQAELSPDAREYVATIRDSVLQMGILIDDLLNLARVGRKQLVAQVTGLNSLVEEVRRDLDGANPDRLIEWKVATLPFVECDPGLMKQVFASLLSNAVKFTRPRKPAVIEVGVTYQDGARAVFVRDNGVGFNMKYAHKLFGVFQRLHRTEDFEGTGVGLATVQRIIHKHGGRLWGEAELDKGATFCFTLGSADDPAVEKASSG